MQVHPLEIALLLALVLVLFGADRVPEVFAELAKALRNLGGGPR